MFTNNSPTVSVRTIAFRFSWMLNINIYVVFGFARPLYYRGKRRFAFSLNFQHLIFFIVVVASANGLPTCTFF